MDDMAETARAIEEPATNLAPAVVFEDVSGYENGTMVLDQASFQVPRESFL